VYVEIVLVATILVLGMVVGLAELQSAIVGELSDVASAFGNVDQSYSTSGYVSYKASGGVKARTYGASSTTYRTSVTVTRTCQSSATIQARGAATEDCGLTVR